MTRIPHTFTASYILFIQDGKILLSRRYQTGFEDGNYSLPAGHTEAGESFTTALIREIEEETGITLKSEEVRTTHIMHRKAVGRENIDVFFMTEKWSGIIENKEPNKCDDLSWFPLTELPQNIIPYVRQAIEQSMQGISYSEYGF